MNTETSVEEAELAQAISDLRYIAERYREEAASHERFGRPEKASCEIRAVAIDTVLATIERITAERDEAYQEIDRLNCLLTPEQVDRELERLGIDVQPAWLKVKEALDKHRVDLAKQGGECGD